MEVLLDAIKTNALERGGQSGHDTVVIAELASVSACSSSTPCALMWCSPSRAGFDHHCPFMDACISTRTFKPFVCFLFVRFFL
jgi:hypothetical protein